MTGWELSAPQEVTVEDFLPRSRPLMSSAAPLSSERNRVPPRPPVKVARMRVDFSQVEARAERRRGSLVIHYRAFDVAAEVRDVCAPLVAEVADLVSTPPLFGDRLPGDPGQPAFFGDADPVLWAPGLQVVAVAVAVHRLRLDLTELLARVRLSEESRARVAAAVSDPAHGRRPVIDNDGLRSGRWLHDLVDHVAPLSADVAAVVARQPAGRVSDLDDAVSAPLWGPDGFDFAVGSLARRVEDLRRKKARRVVGERDAAAQSADRERQRMSEQLRRLGLS